MLIGNLVPGIIKKLRGRDDLTNDIPFYIKKAVLDLSESYEFDELRVSGPITNFTETVSEYPKSGNKCPFINDSDARLTFVVTWFVWFNNNTPTLGVDTGYEIKYRQPRVVEPMSKISGIPTFYTQVGGLLIVGFLPDQTYATQMRYQREHPFPQLSGNLSQDAATLNSTQLYMPNDWQDIIEYVAAAKAADDVGMNDIATGYNQRVFGYKDPKGRETPGIIQVRQSQQDRNSTYNERQLRPVVRRYSR